LGDVVSPIQRANPPAMFRFLNRASLRNARAGLHLSRFLCPPVVRRMPCYRSYIESQVSDKTSLVEVWHTFVTKLLFVTPQEGIYLNSVRHSKMPAVFCYRDP
jgi:hypothetical protein